MLPTRTIIVLLLPLLIFCIAPDAGAKKVKTTPPTSSKTPATDASSSAQYKQGSFMVASDCSSCNNGYTIEQVQYYGYDKPAVSDFETFFVKNTTDAELTGLSFYIEYIDALGHQLHKRFVKIERTIPAGETRKIDIKSWDKQHSFRYVKSRESRTPSTTYSIRIIPVAYWLRYND